QGTCSGTYVSVHSLEKENNRKRRKEAGCALHQNDSDDEINHSNNALNDDYNETIDSNDQSSDDDIETNLGNKATLEHYNATSERDECTADDDNSNSATNRIDKDILINPVIRINEKREKDDNKSDDECGYYNPKDKRRWMEEA
ncbi:unnamed protein product, partial [Rotaria sp. Silwood2]